MICCYNACLRVNFVCEVLIFANFALAHASISASTIIIKLMDKENYNKAVDIEPKVGSIVRYTIERKSRGSP